MTKVGNQVYFVAKTDALGFELWTSDGTSEGTTVVKDIVPGRLGGYPEGLRDLNGTLIFTAVDGIHGKELWRSDGREEGTELIADLRVGELGSNPVGFTEFQGALYFTAYFSPEVTFELLRTDGTPDGTELVADIAPGTAPSAPQWLTNVDDKLLYFAASGETGGELWVSDGTNEGTRLVKDINSTQGPVGNVYSSYPQYITQVGDLVYFAVDDGLHGIELWKSDGTEEGTVLVKDIAPGNHPFYGDSNPHYLVNVNGTLFFRADDGAHGTELWQSDGTAEGTRMVADIFPGTYSSIPLDLTWFKGALYFSASDPEHGDELWKLAPIPGDTNFDDVVDLVDLNYVRNNFGYVGDLRPGDVTGDGRVDLDDLNAVRNNFGAGTGAPALPSTLPRRTRLPQADDSKMGRDEWRDVGELIWLRAWEELAKEPPRFSLLKRVGVSAKRDASM